MSIANVKSISAVSVFVLMITVQLASTWCSLKCGKGDPLPASYATLVFAHTTPLQPISTQIHVHVCSFNQPLITLHILIVHKFQLYNFWWYDFRSMAVAVRPHTNLQTLQKSQGSCTMTALQPCVQQTGKMLKNSQGKLLMA